MRGRVESNLCEMNSLNVRSCRTPTCCTCSVVKRLLMKILKSSNFSSLSTPDSSSTAARGGESATSANLGMSGLVRGQVTRIPASYNLL